jgi:cytochrome c oxidase assembly protein subunit 15
MLARLTAGATLVLIVAGGLVTTTGAGLAVPDWPTTFGRPMLLYPPAGLAGGVLVEHSHRLLGSVVGLLTVALAVAVWLRDRRGWLRGLAAVAVVLVSVQGVLGGLRVVWLADALALVHGCLAQLFFALTAVLVVVTGPAWAAAGAAGDARAPWGTAAAAAGLTYGQVVLGALTTHAGWIGTHVAGAVVVTGALGLLAARLAAAGTPVLRRGGRILHVGLGVQLALGLGAYLARFTGVGLPGGELAVIGLPVAHRAVGAVLLATTVGLAVLAARSGRRRAAGDRARPAGAPAGVAA